MTTHRWLTIGLVALLGAFGAGCGGGNAEVADESDDDFDTAGGDDAVPGDSTEGHQSARELLGITPPEQPWAEMSHGDREMDMVGRFHPIFREYFVEHDAEEFAEFGCESCHGSDMQARNFEMPNPELPPVPPAGTPEYAALHEAHGEMMTFMEEEVTPAMQTMLGLGASFTCNGCHPGTGGGEASLSPSAR